ncbi:hypothetical protein [Dokdonia donghaensis]|uniref:Uncharacterized protein n=1 Tax=Dokdonia donghaensis DSW-1 TaxID=1300343 RepID=A0A0A2GXU6_9FLAO|nr:hypothetical protein [Dokdonia donghaensis]ANH59836.1 hypothetical protein I597_0910 [Dokdonia donghaensis DSW-1]KGO07166.1 hypothetical protein NV36_10185 [Dokdonia donghaensis DSW-1]
MKKFIITALLILTTISSYAHQTEASTIILAEKEKGVWILQINASLTAFQQEVRQTYASTPYKTPEEFREMVLNHITQNLNLSFNENQNYILTDGKVQLGHETKVLFTLTRVPSNLETIDLTNTLFKNIHNSKSALLILKEDFKKTKFVLNKDNNYSLSLSVTEDEFIDINIQKASMGPVSFLSILALVIAVALLSKKVYKRA